MTQRSSQPLLLDLQPIVFAISLIAGVGLYFSFLFEPSSDVVFIGGSLSFAFAIALVRLSHRNDLNAVLIVFLGLNMGFCAAQLRANAVESPRVSEMTGPLIVEGWIRAVQPGEKGPRLLIDVHALQNRSVEQTPKFVRLTHRSTLEVAPGRFVRCWAVLRPPPQPTLQSDYNFERQAYFQRLGAVGYVQGRCRGGVLGAPHSLDRKISSQIGAFRHQLARSVYDIVGEEAGGFASAVVSGDRSFLSQSVQADLRQTGLAHLLAISGLHMGLVGGLVYFVVARGLVMIEFVALRVPVQKPAAFVALLASLAYLIVSGASVSTQRAFVMAAVVFGAIIFDRSAISLRTFAIAMILVVISQPESVVTPGFQMSFAATGALIATYEAWNRRRAYSHRRMGKILFFFSSLAVTSIVATIATAPFAVYHFGRAAPLSIFANLIVLPIITFVSAPLAAVSLFLSPFGLSELPLQWFGRSLEWVQRIAAWFASFDFSGPGMSKQMPIGALFCFTLGILLAGLCRGVWRAICGGAMVFGGFALWALAPSLVFHWSESGDVYFRSSPNTQFTRINAVESDGLAPLRFADLALSHSDTKEALHTMEWGKLLISRNNLDQSARIEISSDQDYMISWENVLSSGGVTAKLQINGQLEFQILTCRKRPWSQCDSGQSH